MVTESGERMERRAATGLRATWEPTLSARPHARAALDLDERRRSWERRDRERGARRRVGGEELEVDLVHGRVVSHGLTPRKWTRTC